jgi:hypothetical protein
MINEYKIKIKSKNILDIQKSFNIQEGGYNKMTENEIINLWQNPDYNETYINFYSLINKFLRGIKIEIRNKWLSALKLNSKKDFIDFMIYYINKLTKIIYKNISTTTKIFYRGEKRKTFNYNVGDTIYYSTFQSITSSITTAYKFSETIKDIKILFIIEIPEGCYYKPLFTQLKIHNYKEKRTLIIDEKEYIVMPNSYYVIVDTDKLYNDTNIIKMRLCEQKYCKITKNKSRECEEIKIKNKEKNNFKCEELEDFIDKTKKYEENINKLISMKDYYIDIIFYAELIEIQNINIFNLDIENINKINEITNEITEYNIKEKSNEINNLGIGYYDYELSNVSKYKKKIERINIILNTNFKSIDNLVVYAGYYNIDYSYKKPEFIEYIYKKKINEEFEYDKILITNLEKDKFLYNDIYNDDYPNRKIKKDKKTKLMYYKYLIKFNLVNIKMCVCSTHPYEYCNDIILIPKYYMKITSKIKKKNRHNLEYIEYEINMYPKY